MHRFISAAAFATALALGTPAFADGEVGTTVNATNLTLNNSGTIKATATTNGGASDVVAAQIAVSPLASVGYTANLTNITANNSGTIEADGITNGGASNVAAAQLLLH